MFRSKSVHRRKLETRYWVSIVSAGDKKRLLHGETGSFRYSQITNAKISKSIQRFPRTILPSLKIFDGFLNRKESKIKNILLQKAHISDGEKSRSRPIFSFPAAFISINQSFTFVYSKSLNTWSRHSKQSNQITFSEKNRNIGVQVEVS